MTYLDDPDHQWELDPTSLTHLRSLVSHFAHIARNRTDEEGLNLILRGYAGLKQRHPEYTDEQCFDTSMIWYFG